MKRKSLLFMALMATTMTFAQDLPDAITNSLEMYSANGTADALKLSADDVAKSEAFWGVDEDSKTQFTLEFWYQVGAQSGQQQFMSATGSGSIRLVSAPKNGFFIYINGVKCAFIDYPGANPNNPIIPRNEWHHIAITFNAGALEAYYDGKQITHYSWNDKATVDGMSAADAIAELAQEERCPILDRSASGGYMSTETALKPVEEADIFIVQAPNHDLSIADIRYWNKALSAGTIQEWYNKYVTSSHPNYKNLQHNWKMNEMYDLGDDKFSIPDRGKLGLTGLVNTDDIAKYPAFTNENDVTVVPTGIATAKTLNASFIVNEGSREITVTAEKLEGAQNITIFDAQGRAVYHAVETAHGGRLIVSAPQVAGLYFVQIGAGSTAFVGKVAITR